MQTSTNWRGTVLAWAAQQDLGAAATRRLLGLAQQAARPAPGMSSAGAALAVAAACLGGFGVLLWVAAQWPGWGRPARFAVLQAVVAVAGGVAWRWPRVRAPFGLLALLGTGALFAYFGQTYQTGADLWQLFALWAAVALPLCLGVRRDALWVPWSAVALTAVAVWTWHAAGPRSGWHTSGAMGVHLAGWALAAAVVAVAAPAARRFTGAGAWTLRTAATATLAGITLSAVGGLFFRDVGPIYFAGLAVLAAAMLGFTRPGLHDLYALSAAALGLDTLLVCGLGDALIDQAGGDGLGALGILGLFAAVLLAATVHAVMRVARARSAREGAA